MIEILASFYSINPNMLDDVKDWDPRSDLLSELLRLLALNPNTSKQILNVIRNIMNKMNTYNNIYFKSIYYKEDNIERVVPYTYLHLLTNPDIDITTLNEKRIDTKSAPINLKYLINIYSPDSVDIDKNDISNMETVLSILIKDRYDVNVIKNFYEKIEKYIVNLTSDKTFYVLLKDYPYSLQKFVVEYGDLDTVKYIFSKTGIPETSNDKVKLIIVSLINIKDIINKYTQVSLYDEVVYYLADIFGYTKYRIDKFNLFEVARKSGDSIKKLKNTKLTNKEFNETLKKNIRFERIVDLLLTYPDNKINNNILQLKTDVLYDKNLEPLTLLHDNRVDPSYLNGKYIVRVAGGAGDTHIEKIESSVLIRVVVVLNSVQLAP
jgi:hypothetical protein